MMHLVIVKLVPATVALVPLPAMGILNPKVVQLEPAYIFILD